jgi:FlaG/FlaF family flagellin (archaellin)
MSPDTTITTPTEDRGLSTVVAIVILIFGAISIGGAMYIKGGEIVSEASEPAPEAEIVADPGRSEIGLRVRSADTADNLSVVVNGNRVENATDESLAPTPQTVLTLGKVSNGADVNISAVDPTAWDSDNNRIAPGTLISVVATANDKERTVFEFRQP